MSESSAPDPKLLACLARLKSGDTSAQGELIELTQNRLYRFALYLSGNRELAQDLCQDCYMKVFKAIESMENPARFFSWLFRIAKNQFLDHCDSAGRQAPSFKEDLAKSFEDTPSGEDIELMIGVRAALTELEPEDRLLVLSVDLEGLSYAEAAELLGISEAAVRSRLHRARQLLVKIMEKP